MPPIFNIPLVAADFLYRGKMLIGLDLNVAPGLSGTGLEAVLPPSDAVAAITRSLLAASAKAPPS